MYGRRMMKGVLESKGLKVAKSRVVQALQRVDPIHYTKVDAVTP